MTIRKKKLLTILSMVLIIIVANYAILVRLPGSFLKKRVIRIAVPGPMNTENGREMLRGAELYLDKINKQNRFENTKLELLVFDDKNRQTAIKIANQVANDDKTMLVIGHYSSTGSVVAGSVYRKMGIPAITASATSEDVTLENDWYFRVIPENRLITDFITDYMKKGMDIKSASIIYDTDQYGLSLARYFQSDALKKEIHIKKKWEIDTEGKNVTMQIKTVTGRLRAAEDLGTIFCATHSSEAVEFFASLRYPGTDYPVVAPDSLSTPSFISLFNNYPREQSSPGYYSDGIYAVSHFFPDMAGEKGQAFRRDFIRKYGREPSWVAACYYDAMNVALIAIERAEIIGQDIRKDRRNIRDALARLNHPDIAIKGVAGNIYFDKEGNVVKPLFMGVWHRQRFSPTFRQYREPQPEEPGDTADITHETSASDAPREQKGNQPADQPGNDQITIGERVMSQTRVVYAGIDINEIFNLDPDKGVFTADFYLWFRFQGEFDDTSIIFTNAANPVRHIRLFMEDTAEKDIFIRSYRVIADFKTDFDTSEYPFDRQALRISIRHAEHPETKLIYIPDISGFPLAAQDISSREKNPEENMLRPIAGWNVRDILFYQDILKTPGKKGISYSQFNAEIQISRKHIGSLFAKTFFPVIAVIVILYTVCLIPPDQPGARAFVLALSVASTGAIHLYMEPAHKLAGYAFTATYILAGISVLISAFIYVANKRGFAARFPVWAEKYIYVFAVITAGIFLAYKYSEKTLFLSLVWQKSADLSELLKTWLFGILQ